jgi:hypothetical protein
LFEKFLTTIIKEGPIITKPFAEIQRKICSHRRVSKNISIMRPDPDGEQLELPIWQPWPVVLRAQVLRAVTWRMYCVFQSRPRPRSHWHRASDSDRRRHTQAGPALRGAASVSHRGTARPAQPGIWMYCMCYVKCAYVYVCWLYDLYLSLLCVYLPVSVCITSHAHNLKKNGKVWRVHMCMYVDCMTYSKTGFFSRNTGFFSNFFLV